MVGRRGHAETRQNLIMERKTSHQAYRRSELLQKDIGWRTARAPFRRKQLDKNWCVSLWYFGGVLLTYRYVLGRFGENDACPLFDLIKSICG
jgi:hypothetical protein